MTSVAFQGVCSAGFLKKETHVIVSGTIEYAHNLSV